MGVKTVSKANQISDMDATTLAEQIRQGHITSLEATNTYIERIKQIQPKLNCVVEERFDEARKEAKKADEKLITADVSGALFGVPISIKESFDVKGMKTTGGLIHRKNNVAENDAEIVKKLKDAGAIILCKTNTPVLCFCQETDNKLYGRTNNPWDYSRTAGGSSGGEGSLLAAGGAAVGIGSDIGGSIRFPSHFNGVIGFKSGNKQVSQNGSFPYVHNPLQERMLGIGAIGKSVQDTAMINTIIANSVPKKMELNRFKIIAPQKDIHYPLSNTTKEAMTKTIKHLQKQFPIFDETPPFFHESALLWQLIMSIDGAKEGKKIAYRNERHSPLKEFLQEQLFQSSKVHHYYSWAAFGANLFRPSEKKRIKLEEEIMKGESILSDYLQNKVIILPVYHTTALPHGKVYWELFSIWKTFKKFIPFVAFANTWGLPSLTIPVEEDDSSLPIGIQVISKVGNEDAIFQVGKMIEQIRGYRRAPVNQ
ncbi:amidase [Bacillus kwashiorkori]|uniref:amidase n=1 Tax=Bacillus kwashiorkori TaxID=1522318 RepID=UPI000B0C6DF6|nr:amidase [Bacillus kwashiorkori]